jgi:hypothetical protein
VIGSWFECAVDPPAASAPIENMLANRWVSEDGPCFIDQSQAGGPAETRSFATAVISIT